MESRRDKVKLGIFLVATIVLAIIVLFTLVGLKLQREEDRYFLEYEQSVTGLKSGSMVTLSGVRVGEVRAMQVNPDNVEQIEVTIGLAPGTPVKVDTRAYLLSQGITGLKYIDLQESTREAARLEPGSQIKTGRGLIDKLSDRADTFSATADDIVRNLAYITREENRERIDRVLANVDRLIQNANMFMEEATKTMMVVRGLVERNESSIDKTIVGIGEASEEFRGVLRQAQMVMAQARETIKKAEVDALVRGLNDTNEELRAKIASVEVDALSEAISTLQMLIVELTRSLSQNQEQLRATMLNMRQTSGNLKDLSRSLRDKPSRIIFEDEPEERQLP